VKERGVPEFVARDRTPRRDPAESSSVLRAFRRQWTRVVFRVLIVIFALAHVAGVVTLSAVEHFDRLTYDMRVRLGAPQSGDPRIAIVDIDEASLARVGRWPWGRNVVAELTDRLFERYGARIVAFDVVFAEPDHSSGLRVLDDLAAGRLREDSGFLQTLENMRESLDHDAQLARTLARHPVVLGFYVSNDLDAREYGTLPAPTLRAGAFAGRPIDFYVWRGHNGNLAAFQSAALGGGHFNSIPDADGVSRRVPMLVEYRGNYYESLSVAVLRHLEGGQGVKPVFRKPEGGTGADNPLIALQVGSHVVPVDERGAALVPFRGGRGTFAYFSAVDLLEDRMQPRSLEGRIVIVGTSAPGLFDLRATPMASVFPGVEIHANLVSGILDRSIKASRGARPFSEKFAIVVSGLLLALTLPFLSPLRSVVLALVVVAGFLVYAQVAWSGFGTYVPVAAPVGLAALLLALNVLHGYFVETRARRRMAQLFGEYVPPALVNQMAEDPEKYTGDAKNEIITCMFGDLRNFTSLAETLDPTALRRLLNEYFTEVSLVIHDHRGTVDKYLGDGVMAFWGAPLPDPDHARNAVRAALAMQDAVRRVEGRLPFQPGSTLAIGIGINTGLASVGDMGSRLRREYTAIGDPINLAARLESLTKYYNVGIVLGARTRELIPELVCRELDRVRVKGKEQAVSIYEPLGFEADIGQTRAEELRIWTQMLRAYRSQDWDQGDLALMNLKRLFGAAELYALYSSRIAYLRQHPPGPDWDGVTMFDRK